jgi:hypothetical protein
LRDDRPFDLVASFMPREINVVLPNSVGAALTPNALDRNDMIVRRSPFPGDA